MRRRSAGGLLTLGFVLLTVGLFFTGTIRAGDNLDFESDGVIRDSFWDSRLFDGTPGFPDAILWFHDPAGMPAGLNQTAFEARIQAGFDTWDAVDAGIPGAPIVPIVHLGGQTSADPYALDGINTVGWQADGAGGVLATTPCWVLTEPTTTINDGAGQTVMPIDGGPPIPFPGPIGVTYPIGAIIDCGMRFDSADSWSTADTPFFLNFDVQAIATHEQGHFIGLSHSTLGDFTGVATTSATMLPFAAYGDSTFRTLEEDDKASVLRTYARNHAGGSLPQTVGGRGVVKLRLLQGAACTPATGVSVVAYRTSGGIDGPGRVEAFSGSQFRLGLGDEPANGSVTLNVLPLSAGQSYTIYARTLEQGVGEFSSQRYNYTTINSNLLDPQNQHRTFDHLALLDTVESGTTIDLGGVGILGCWPPDASSPIDLVAQSITAPNDAFRGSQIAVTSSFKNNGTTASTAFSVGVYFSTDQTINSADVFAGLACTVSSLAPGATGTCNGSATVPNIAPGDYYVGLLVDTQNHIRESFENNNGISTGHLTSVHPSALNPIVNGSFETGDLTGWTVKELTSASNPNLPISVRGFGVEYPAATFLAYPYFIILDYFTSAPTDGQWAVLHDFNGNDPATSGFVNRRELYQEITLPPGTTTLQFDYRAAWELFRYGSTQSRTFSVELEPAGGGPTIFSETVLDAPSGTYEEDTDNPSGGVGDYPPGNIDLSAYGGQNVRLKFVWNIPEPGTGFGFFQLDNIRLNATAGNTPPVVTVTTPVNGSTFVAGTSIVFAATASDAEQGDLSAGLVWTSNVSGQIGTGASFSTSALSVGTHTITASVTDSGGAPGSGSITVTVTAANTPPTVAITAPANGASFVQGTLIAFAGTANDTQQGNLSASLVWTSNVDGQIGTGASFSTSTLSVGAHTITASVTDSGGATGSASITLTVTANTPPTVAITAPANGASFVAGTSIAFTGTANDAQQGDLSANLVWTSSINGQIGTGASFSTTALSVGAHTITASVTDSSQAPGSSAITLTVTTVPNTPPTVAITAPANGASFVAGTSITFTGTATDAQDGPLSGNLVWTSSLTPSGPIGTGASFSIPTLSVGTHTITASVIDSGLLSGSSSISVTVTPPTTDVDNLAAADVSTSPGTVAPGTSFQDTRTENDTYEQLTEARQGNGGNARSVLSHTWQFQVVVGAQYVFKVAAHHSGTEDNFLFSYSRDNVTFLPMTTVTATTDTDAVQTYVFPQDMQGIVYVRVNDTDNTRGNSQLDTLFVDFLAITSLVSGTPMTPPVVVITSPSSGASFTAGTSVSFVGSANDGEDGPLGAQLQWTSSINGFIGSGASFSTSVLSVGAHTITAAVTDSDGMQGTASIALTINGATSITLSAVGYKVKGIRFADLTWSGATTGVTIFRNGSPVGTGPSAGQLTDEIGGKGAGSFIYRVCETGSSNCSNEVTVVF